MELEAMGRNFPLVEGAAKNLWPSLIEHKEVPVISKGSRRYHILSWTLRMNKL